MANSNGINILTGILVAGAIAGASTYLLSSNNRRYKRQISRRYRDVRARMSDFLNGINSNAQYLSSGLASNASEWGEKAQDFIEWARDQLKVLGGREYKELRLALIGGAIIIGLVGTAAVIMASSKSGKDTSEILDRINSQICSWKKVIKNILATVQDRAEDTLDQVNRAGTRLRHKFESNGRSHARSNTINEVIDFASSGLQLWQNLKNR